MYVNVVFCPYGFMSTTQDLGNKTRKSSLILLATVELIMVGDTMQMNY